MSRKTLLPIPWQTNWQLLVRLTDSYQVSSPQFRELTFVEVEPGDDSGVVQIDLKPFRDSAESLFYFQPRPAKMLQHRSNYTPV